MYVYSVGLAPTGPGMTLLHDTPKFRCGIIVLTVAPSTCPG